jgi:ribosomal protection tetracycline resistance protein
MRSLNLGILAHVDAGKTTLTERLLYNAGVIDAIGSVDDGNTQTDTLALERERGITIKAAVASFVIDDVAVNLIDTPGHPDFIAEVERALSVLDGVVLVISAVEGVQPQTRVLMRALQRLRIPTLLFVNKIDRAGARDDGLLEDIGQKLTPHAVATGFVTDLGTRAAGFNPCCPGDPAFEARLAEALAEQDETLLARLVEGHGIPYCELREALCAQVQRAVLHPVLFGSAITGAGVEALTSAIAELLPAAAGDPDGPVSARVFKVERGPSGEKIAYVRMFSGTVRIRDRLHFGDGAEATVTAVHAFDGGPASATGVVAAGQIGKLWGLDARVGDSIGTLAPTAGAHYFAPPTLETVVAPRAGGRKGSLYFALAQLAEQDPLINLRQDDLRQELFLSLYGEVQKEVIQETLARDYRIDVDFRETTTICVERPVGMGEAVEFLGQPPNPFLATIGLRIEPAAANTGFEFRLATEVLGRMPLAYFKAVEATLRDTLREGLHGWQVTDCTVTMTHADYLGKHGLGHQYFNKSMSSTGEDFRNLTPLVLMAALNEAGTTVCEPVHRFHLEIPADTFGTVAPALAHLGGIPTAQDLRSGTYVLEGDIPAARVHDLHLQLPALTRGEGVLESAFDRHEPVRGEVPTRSRSDNNPLDRKKYLLHVQRRV